jgi:ferredoxin-NADP reductase
MERAALLGRLRAPVVWRLARVREVTAAAAGAATIVFDVDDWPGHTAGQHVDVRLTAEDGYQAQRSYSIASAPEDPQLKLTVERIDDGEVSPYLTDELRAGDQFELRGPVGGHFTWRVENGGPLLLVGGGSGLVPLMAMLRHKTAHAADLDARLVVSARRWDDLLFRDELRRTDNVTYTLTRETPDGWTGFDRRIDRAMLELVGPDPSQQPFVFVCGSTGFVERAADILVELGHAPSAIHAERFGPTG